MLPSTVTVFELLFVSLALPLTGYSWWMFHESMRSRNYWESQGMNGVTELNTRASLRSASILFIVSVFIVLVGLTAMSLPRRYYDPPVEPAWILAINPTLAITVVGLLLYNTIANRNTRERLIAFEVDRVRNDKLIATYKITTHTSDEELADYAGQEMTRRTVSRPGVPMLRYLTDIRDRLRRLEREAGR